MQKYPLHRDMAEYGFDKFSMHVIEELDDIRTIFDREQYWIDHFESMYPNGYNIAPAISSKKREQRHNAKDPANRASHGTIENFRSSVNTSALNRALQL